MDSLIKGFDDVLQQNDLLSTSQQQIDYLISTINFVFDDHAPKITKSIPIKNYKKYISDKTKKLINRRKMCYSLFKRKPSPSLKSKF